MDHCPTCGSTLEADSSTETPDDDGTGVTISSDDFDFMLKSFETLMSPYASTAELQASIKAENDIWALLQTIVKRQEK